MFYSHTFLARKGPLGTVWCAAHLHHKLKKSHYAATDIPSTVERIIYPEVPIALRMSGHLLLGVVRIYSKKVEYLHHDCNVLWVSLRNAFRATDVNLPENATQANFNAVTFPETYALDALEIDDDLSLDGSQDHHLKSRDEITLRDQFPADRELYVRITFDDDIIPGSSQTYPFFQLEGDPMQIDSLRVPDPLDHATHDLGTSQHEETGAGPEGGNFSPPEVLRDQVDNDTAEGGNFSPPEVLRDHVDNDTDVLSPFLRPHVDTSATEPNISLEKDTPHMDIDTPLTVPTSSPDLQLRQSPQGSGPSSPHLEGADFILDPIVDPTSTDFALRPSPVDLELRPSPSPERLPIRSPERPPPRQRRKRQFFDERLVLTNTFCKNAINDYSDIVKKRKKLPCSELEMWRHQSKKRKELVFSEPLISGMSDNLQNLSRKDLATLNPSLIVTEEPEQEPRTAEPREEEPELETRTAEPREEEPELETRTAEPREEPELETRAAEPRDEEPELESRSAEPREPVTNVTEEPEHLRSPDRDPGPNFGEVFPTFTPPLSPVRSLGTVGAPSSSLFPTTVNTESDKGMFSGSTLEIETPHMDFDDRYDRSAGLSDIPEWRSSMEPDELSFLEQDNNSPTDSQGTRKGDSMSVRTRAVAQYLQNHSPSSKSTDVPPNDISLQAILEGKRRKVCARMFYETLVLKDCGLIDLKQDEPYGDITLKLTTRFSTTKL